MERRLLDPVEGDHGVIVGKRLHDGLFAFAARGVVEREGEPALGVGEKGMVIGQGEPEVLGHLVIVRLGAEGLAERFDGLLGFGELSPALARQGVDRTEIVHQRPPNAAIGVGDEGRAARRVVPVQRLEQPQEPNVFEVLSRGQRVVGDAEPADERPNQGYRGDHDGFPILGGRRGRMESGEALKVVRHGDVCGYRRQGQDIGLRGSREGPVRLIARSRSRRTLWLLRSVWLPGSRGGCAG